MALAIRIRELVDQGEVADYADLARLAHVFHARITQIMNLFHLAPDIQEAILFLPRTDGGTGAVSKRAVRRICAVPDWCKQRRMWDDLAGSPDSGTSDPVRRSGDRQSTLLEPYQRGRSFREAHRADLRLE